MKNALKILVADIGGCHVKCVATGHDTPARFRSGSRLLAGCIVQGGGNAARLDRMPPHTPADDNAEAFLGGLRLWQGHDPHAAGPVSNDTVLVDEVEWRNRAADEGLS
jgi:hypothetical protein